MPQYEYKCKVCESRTSITCSISRYDEKCAGQSLACPACMGVGMLRRIYTVPPIRHALEGHFNIAAGQYVSGKRELEDAFKRKSDEATARTGIPHQFAPIDYRDPVLGDHHEGLEETNRKRHDAGLPTTPIPK